MTYSKPIAIINAGHQVRQDPKNGDQRYFNIPIADLRFIYLTLQTAPYGTKGQRAEELGLRYYRTGEALAQICNSIRRRAADSGARDMEDYEWEYITGVVDKLVAPLEPPTSTEPEREALAHHEQFSPRIGLEETSLTDVAAEIEDVKFAVVRVNQTVGELLHYLKAVWGDPDGKKDDMPTFP